MASIILCEEKQGKWDDNIKNVYKLYLGICVILAQINKYTKWSNI